MEVNEMARRLLILVALLASAPLATAATVFNVTGPSPFGFANQQVLVEGWQQNALYNNVTITAPLEDNTSGGPIAGVEGTVYLTNAIGPGTTAGNVIAGPVSISGLTNTFTTRTLFTGLTLNAGNYYLVFVSTNTNPLSMSMQGSSTPVVTAGAGVTPLGGGAALAPNAFPPATSVALSQPGNLFVDVSGTLVSNFAVPAVSSWAMVLLGCVLLLVGIKILGVTTG
jgi:hypothetical protein